MLGEDLGRLERARDQRPVPTMPCPSPKRSGRTPVKVTGTVELASVTRKVTVSPCPRTS